MSWYARKTSSMILAMGAMAVVLLSGGLVRFYNVTRTAMDGFDVWVYLSQASLWNIQPVSPADMYAKYGFIYICSSFIHFCSSLGVNLLYTDYVIPLLNASFDTINIGLIAVLALLMGLSFPVALASAMTYALLPSVILLARGGLSHTTTIFFMLLATICFITAWPREGWRRYAAYFCCGLFSSVAMMCHPTMFALFPVFLSLIVSSHWPNLSTAIAAMTREIVAYIGAVVIPFAYLARYIPGQDWLPFKMWDLVMSSFAHGHGLGVDFALDLSWNKLNVFLYRYLFKELLLPINGTAFVLTGIVFCLSFFIYKRKKKTEPILSQPAQRNILYLIAMSVLCFSVFTIRFNGGETMHWGARLFTPLLPLIVISAYCLMDCCLEMFQVKNRKAVVIGIAGCSSLLTMYLYMPLYMFIAPPFYKYVKMEINNKGGVVDENHRILLIPGKYAPYTDVPHYIAYGDISQLDINNPPLRVEQYDNFIKSNNIAYLVVSRSMSLPFYNFTNSKDKNWIKAVDDAKRLLWPQYASIKHYIQIKGLKLLFRSDGRSIELDSLKGFPQIAVGNHALRVHEIDQLGRQDAFDIYYTRQQ